MNTYMYECVTNIVGNKCFNLTEIMQNKISIKMKLPRLFPGICSQQTLTDNYSLLTY